MNSSNEADSSGPVGLADAVQAVLMEKIKRLESELERATAIAREAQRCTLEHVLRRSCFTSVNSQPRNTRRCYKRVFRTKPQGTSCETPFS